MAKKKKVEANKDLLLLKSILNSQIKSETGEVNPLTELYHNIDNLDLLYNEQARMRLFNESSFS